MHTLIIYGMTEPLDSDLKYDYNQLRKRVYRDIEDYQAYIGLKEDSYYIDRGDDNPQLQSYLEVSFKHAKDMAEVQRHFQYKEYKTGDVQFMICCKVKDKTIGRMHSFEDDRDVNYY